MAAAAPFVIMGLQGLVQSRLQRSQGEYEAHQLDVNAGLADTQAADALARGKEAGSQIATNTRQTIGSQRVGLAGNGVAVDSGSALSLQSDTARLGELDRVMAENNAHRQAWGFQVDAANSRANAEQARSASRNASRQTLLTAASNLYALKKSGDDGGSSSSPATALFRTQRRRY